MQNFSHSVHSPLLLLFRHHVVRNHQANDKLSVYINFCATNFFTVLYRPGRNNVPRMVNKFMDDTIIKFLTVALIFALLAIFFPWRV